MNKNLEPKPFWRIDYNRLRTLILFGAKLTVANLTPELKQTLNGTVKDTDRLTMLMLEQIKSSFLNPIPKPSTVNYPAPCKNYSSDARLTSIDSILKILPKYVEPPKLIYIPKSLYPPFSSFPPRFPGQTTPLMQDQYTDAELLYNKIVLENKSGALLISGTGTGKTYVCGYFFRILLAINYFKGKTFSPYQALVVTKAPAVEETEIVLRNNFGIDISSEVVVTNYEQLRAKLGKEMLEQKMIVKHGEPVKIWRWIPPMHPMMIWWDECQSLKNDNSLQTQIGLAFSAVEKLPTKQVFASATPFTRVCEARYWVVATKARR